MDATSRAGSHNYDKWRKPSELCEITGFSLSYLSKLRMRGEGPPFAKMGTAKQAQVRYRQSDIDAWIESRMRSSTSDNGEGAR
jgi:predicted DNA-binding transcriptional regulator AlpA